MRLLCFFTILFLCSCSSTNTKQTQYAHKPSTVSANSAFTLKLPSGLGVPYHGEINFDQGAQNSASFLYPAPNLVGFLAAIATHAAIVDSVNNGKKTDLQTNADKILVPYKSVVSGFSYDMLKEQSLIKISQNNQKIGTAIPSAEVDSWTLESVPVYIFSQDQKTLTLQNSVTVYFSNKSTAIVYQNLIKIISDPIFEKNPVEYWTQNEGEKLKNLSAELLAQSLKIATEEASKDPDIDVATYKTFHYYRGESEQIERGQLIANSCNRIVIRNLRGWIMSVPSHSSSSAALPNSCTDDQIAKAATAQ
ncbi:MAG: hypothetical protein JWM78_534 [Verrucomicrobiaceae bacterium]|nr:hypothetical protein [Verrucomicrobiaceae bacterium]